MSSNPVFRYHQHPWSYTVPVHLYDSIYMRSHIKATSKSCFYHIRSWFSVETLALYKSLTCLLTYLTNAPVMHDWLWHQQRSVEFCWWRESWSELWNTWPEDSGHLRLHWLRPFFATNWRRPTLFVAYRRQTMGLFVCTASASGGLFMKGRKPLSHVRPSQIWSQTNAKFAT